MEKLRIVHYINQFFAGIGGEERADEKPRVLDELPPISLQLNKKLGDAGEVVGTLMCGDSYFNENLEEALAELKSMLEELNPDLLIAGPAFNAGRYGMACGSITKMAVEDLGIKAFTAMYEENPGVDVFKKDIYIVPTGNSAAKMRKAIPAMTKFAERYVSGEELSPEDDGYFAKGVRENVFTEERGSMRAVQMLVKKLNDEPFKTEYPMPDFDRVEPNKAVASVADAKIAFVTSGGIVPFGNPDHIESSSASKFGRYDIEGVDRLAEGKYETAHGGYDPTYANEVPDRVVPLDVAREMEKEGKIGEIYNAFFSTVGNGTSVANSKRYAEEIAKELVDEGVDAVILTST